MGQINSQINKQFDQNKCKIGLDKHHCSIQQINEDEKLYKLNKSDKGLQCLNKYIQGPCTTTIWHNFNSYNDEKNKIFKNKHKELKRKEVKNKLLIIGDIHGCFDELNDLIKKANQSPEEHTIILVGDLVNKGIKSVDVVKWCRKNNILSVKGNHDQKLLNQKQNNEADHPLFNSILENLNNEDIYQLKNLPQTINIPWINHLIVHSGVLPDIDYKLTDPQILMTMRNLELKEGRNQPQKPSAKVRNGEPWITYYTGPNKIYFGHDARRKYQESKYAIGLDTGCVQGGLLTGVFIDSYTGEKLECISVSSRNMYKNPLDKSKPVYGIKIKPSKPKNIDINADTYYDKRYETQNRAILDQNNQLTKDKFNGKCNDSINKK